MPCITRYTTRADEPRSAHNIFAAPETLADPGQKLEGAGKKSRTLRVRTAKDIDATSIKRFLRAASQ